MRERGFTLLEAMIVLALLAAVIYGQLRTEIFSFREELATLQARQLRLLAQAGERYIRNHYSAVASHSFVTGVADSQAPTLDELKAKGYLSGAFPPASISGGGYLLTLTAGSGGVTGLVATTTPITISGAIDPFQLGAALAELGVDGGAASDTSACSTLQGDHGLWSAPNPAPGAPCGILAARLGPVSASSFGQCPLPWGGAIAHGEAVTAWQAAGAPCTSETRSCNFGVLSGSYGYGACS